MLAIENTLVSELLLEEKFVCDLQQCKGMCCIEGDVGAPLNKKELNCLDDLFYLIQPYLNQKGLQAIQKQGKYVIDEDGEYVTPLVNGKECAYVVFNEEMIAHCAIEQAYLDNKIDFKKPISCHLYPIRIASYPSYDAVNVAYWNICQSAYLCGRTKGVKVYQFVKDALIRKYGKEWYYQLEKEDKY